MSWAARTEPRKGAGSVDIGRNIDATEDAARRRFAAEPHDKPGNTRQSVQARGDVDATVYPRYEREVAVGSSRS